LDDYINTEEKALAMVIARHGDKSDYILQKAEAFAYLKKHYGSIKKISEITKTALSNIRYYIKINELPDAVKQYIKNGKIRSYHLAAELTRIQNTERMISAAEKIFDKKLEISREIIRYVVRNPNEDIDACVNIVLNWYKEDINVSIFVFFIDEILNCKSDIYYLFDNIDIINNIFTKKYSLQNERPILIDDNKLIVIIDKNQLSNIKYNSGKGVVDKNIIKEVIIDIVNKSLQK